MKEESNRKRMLNSDGKGRDCGYNTPKEREEHRIDSGRANMSEHMFTQREVKRKKIKPDSTVSKTLR